MKVRKKSKIKKIASKFNFTKSKNTQKKKTVKKKGTSTTTNTKSKTSNKTKRTKRKLWKRILTFILILGIICVLSVAAFFAFIVISAPKFDEAAFQVNDQTVVYDINNEIITTLGVQKRESVTYDELPQVLIDAIIATEDSRFFQHNGVDLFRFIKATVQQVLGQDAGGASTITMQVAKNNLTKQGKVENNVLEKIVRKFHDLYLAVFKIEKNYSKEEIIEFYVNSYFLGGSTYGVQTASEYYFGKDVSELTLPEAAIIAGLFQSPSKDNPYKDIESATERRDIVLHLMKLHNYITKEEYEIAKNIKIEDLLVGIEESNNYQGYIDVVVREIDELTGENPYTTPMKIYTTMEKGIQDGIDDILNGETNYKWSDDKVQAGIAIVNVETGAIAAIGAGRNRTGILQFNYATIAKRQPGSTAKPIFAYGPAIENNNYSTYNLFNDEPWGYTDGPNVNNWDGKYTGIITMRYALQVSRNVPAIKAYQQTGSKNVHKFASSLGLDVALNSNSENYKILSSGVDNTVNEAYAIGGVAEGFTPLEMASAYSAFASGGYYANPYSVTKIEYRSTGEVKEFKHAKERVMKDSTAYIMNNILESAVNSGFNGGARVSGSHVAAKTGTSNFDEATMKKHNLPAYATNDLWTVAYTSKYSIAVWYGYDEVSSTTYTTSGTPKDQLTSYVMKYIPKDPTGWKMPSSVVASQVESDTWPAQLPSEYTPTNMIKTEYFVRGSQPNTISERFKKLDNVSNLKSTTTGNNTATISWTYETPKVLTNDYLTSYFSNSLYGKQKEKYLNSRKEYNQNTLGPIGFGIYTQNIDGTLTLVDYTTNNTYTYNGYGKTTLVVKAEYQNFKSNASDGLKINLDLAEGSNNSNLNVLMNRTDITVKSGNYTENSIVSIFYDNEIITNKAKVTYQLNDNSNINTYNTKTTLENAVNSLPAGNYKITYIINYQGNEHTESRNITITN